MNGRVATLLGISVLAALVLACGSGGRDQGAPADKGQAAATTEAKKKATIGTAVRDGKFEFTVTKVDCSKTHVGSSDLGQRAQGKFCLVSVTVKNIGKEAQTFDADAQKAIAANGTTYDADSGAAFYVNDDNQTFLNNINPGNQVKGIIPFDVPKDASIATVELHDSFFSGGVSVSIR